MEERRNLYHGDGTHFQIVMSDVTAEEKNIAIRTHIKRAERPSHYLRIWEEDGVQWTDYGSWSAFFVWATSENYEKLLKKNDDRG